MPARGKGDRRYHLKKRYGSSHSSGWSRYSPASHRPSEGGSMGSIRTSEYQTVPVPVCQICRRVFSLAVALDRTMNLNRRHCSSGAKRWY